MVVLYERFKFIKGFYIFSFFSFSGFILFPKFDDIILYLRSQRLNYFSKCISFLVNFCCIFFSIYCGGIATDSFGQIVNDGQFEGFFKVQMRK